ncbi:hypothetical protein EJB05_48530 [Eragrostis curvula]|uniref:Uncharacterized protein n=1 Tax=Eragrostis curvula TaxID=38414 RepID=A0A5J9T4G8_9POAL|nr:hypothetical protein EJB05_48530 [Eragrostis curvula]
MFSPSGRLSHFSGRHGVEDVILRYMNLPEHDREEAVQNREYLISMLQRLKREGDVATQLANPGALNEKIEEIQQEIFSCQQQLHVSEERLRSAARSPRLFEPDPAMFGSTGEMDGRRMRPRCSGTRSRWREWARSPATPLCGAPTRGRAPAPDVRLIRPDDLPQEVYDATSQVAGLNGEPPCAAGEGAGAGDDAEVEADAWREEYTCTELLSTLIPTTPFPLMQHCLGLGPDDQFLPMQEGGMAEAAAQEQEPGEASASCSYVPSDETGGTPVMAYDSTVAPANVPGADQA